GRGQGNVRAHVRRAQVLLPQHARLRLASVHEKKVRRPRRERLPDVRSDEDCRRLIATLEKPIYRGCFTLIYAYGLRITEAVTLPITAVDSKQMGVIAPVPRIMRLFWAFSLSNPPASPSQEESSLANMPDTLEARCRSDGPPAGPRSIDPLPGSRSFLTVSAVA